MAALKTLLADVKTLINTISGLEKSVSIWDYSILDDPRPIAIVLRPGAMRTELDAYGDQYLRTINVQLQVYAYYGPAGMTEATNRLLDAVDLLDDLFMRKFHLGSTIDVYQTAKVTFISDASTMARREGTTDWMRCIMTLAVEMPDQPSGAAQ